jgi:cobalt-zinc-cadmium efflux system protein
MVSQAAPIEVHSSHKHSGSHSDGAHSEPRATRSRRRLRIVLMLTALYMLAEALGGWWTGSLALLADAGHMLADVAALALALIAVWFSSRPATPSKTFGYYRLEILAAWVNGVTLVIIALLICYEAYERWAAPPSIKSTQMLLVASGGLLINLTCAWLLHGEHKHDMNMHGAWLHIIGDALGSLGAIIAGTLMWIYEWYIADPLVSVAIGLLIVWSSWSLIRVSTNVLLEGTPAHINLAAVENAILQTDGVQDVHDLHVWTITSGREALSAHVIHAENTSQPELLKELRAKLYEKFGVDHLTIQMETLDFEDETFHFCHTGMACFRSERE